MTQTAANCAYEGCPHPVKSRGWCNGHYMQLRRGATLTPVKARRPSQPCAVDDCGSPARDYKSGQGLCSKHHQRWRAHGDPLKLTKWVAYETGLQAIREAVANRDRSECWLDWSELPCWETLDGWGGAYRAGYPILGRGERVMWLAMSEDGRPRPAAPKNYGLHSCDTPACWNPDHLRWGTHGENLKDRAGKLNYCKHCVHCNPDE